MSQNVTLPATISAAQSLAVEALASNERRDMQRSAFRVRLFRIFPDRESSACSGLRRHPALGRDRQSIRARKMNVGKEPNGTTAHAGCRLSRPLKDAAFPDE
jgi:hypothetical protein